CADAFGNAIHCGGLGDLVAIDKKSGFMENADSSKSQLFLRTTYHLAVQHDGKHVTSSLDGQQQATIGCGPLHAGGVLLWTHSAVPVAYSRLAVEGPLDPAFLEHRRHEWVEQQMQAWK